MSELPDHPSIQRATVDTSDDQALPPYLLKVDRPRLTRSPAPPVVLADWLERGWDDPFAEPSVRRSQNETDARGDTVVVEFESSPERVEALATWAPERQRWAANERPARRAMKVFERLYELRGRIDREAGAVELVVGDGVLDWPRPDGRVHHPVLLQRVEQQFDPDGPSFTIVQPPERGPELYSQLLHSLPEVDGQAIARWQAAMAHDTYHPLGGATTSAFLRRLVVELSARGELVEDGPVRGEPDLPRIGREPVLFLRQRTQGFSTAIEAVLEDLARREELPGPLLGIVGVQPEAPAPEGEAEPIAPAAYHDEVEDVLLSKPANPEQIRLIRRLERSSAVLVQGPPGTGKSHTIANQAGASRSPAG